MVACESVLNDTTFVIDPPVNAGGRTPHGDMRGDAPVPQTTLYKTLEAVSGVGDLIDTLAGDGEGLSMAQIEQGMTAVQALGSTQAHLEELTRSEDLAAADTVVRLNATLVDAAAALRLAKAHVDSYQVPTGIAQDVMEVNSSIEAALEAIAARGL